MYIYIIIYNYIYILLIVLYKSTIWPCTPLVTHLIAWVKSLAARSFADRFSTITFSSVLLLWLLLRFWFWLWSEPWSWKLWLWLRLLLLFLLLLSLLLLLLLFLPRCRCRCRRRRCWNCCLNVVAQTLLLKLWLLFSDSRSRWSKSGSCCLLPAKPAEVWVGVELDEGQPGFIFWAKEFNFQKNIWVCLRIGHP